MLNQFRGRFSNLIGKHQTATVIAGSTLVLIVVFGASMIYRHYLHKRHESRMAHHRMSAKFLCSHALKVDGKLVGTEYYFPHSNITDEDLAVFELYFNGYATSRRLPVVQMDLKGSPVSEEAIARFRRNVPECMLVP